MKTNHIVMSVICLIAIISTLGCRGYMINKQPWRAILYKDNYVNGRLIGYYRHIFNLEFLAKTPPDEKDRDYTLFKQITNQPLIYNNKDGYLYLCPNRIRDRFVAKVYLGGDYVSGGFIDSISFEQEDNYYNDAFFVVITSKNEKYSFHYGSLNRKEIKLLNSKEKSIGLGKLVAYKYNEYGKKRYIARNNETISYLLNDNETLISISLPELEIKNKQKLPNKMNYVDNFYPVFNFDSFGFDGANLFVSGHKISLQNESSIENAKYFCVPSIPVGMEYYEVLRFFYDGKYLYKINFEEYKDGIQDRIEINKLVAGFYENIFFTEDGIYNVYPNKHGNQVSNKISDENYKPGYIMSEYRALYKDFLLYKEKGDKTEFLIYKTNEDGKVTEVFNPVEIQAKVYDFDFTYSIKLDELVPLIFTDKGLYIIENIYGDVN